MQNLLKLCLFLLCFETGKYCLHVASLCAEERQVNHLFTSPYFVCGVRTYWLEYMLAIHGFSQVIQRSSDLCFCWEVTVAPVSSKRSLSLQLSLYSVYCVSLTKTGNVLTAIKHALHNLMKSVLSAEPGIHLIVSMCSMLWRISVSPSGFQVPSLRYCKILKKRGQLISRYDILNLVLESTLVNGKAKNMLSEWGFSPSLRWYIHQSSGSKQFCYLGSALLFRVCLG